MSEDSGKADRIESAAQRLTPRRASSWLLWSVVSFFVLLLLWTSLAQVDRTVHGQGRVIPGFFHSGAAGSAPAIAIRCP